MHRTSLIVGGTFCMLLAQSGSTRAQVEPPPTTQPAAPATEEAPGRGPMSLDELSATVGFDAEMERRKVRTARREFFGPGPWNQTNEVYRFEETLGLQGSGSIVNDRVLRYDAMARFGLSQESYREARPGPDLNTDPHGQVLEYDLRLQALPAGRISATGFASLLEDRIPRPFLPSLNRHRERYGGQITYSDPKLPMSLSYEHLFDDIEGRSRQYQDDEQFEEDTLRYEATWQPTDDHTLQFDYEYERRGEQYSGTDTHFNTERNYFSLTDVIQFGAQQKHRMETRIRLEDERGDLARDSYEFAPHLHLQHTDSLSSFYKGQFLKESYENASTDLFRGDVGLTHQLGQSLTSTLSLYGLEQRADSNFDQTEWGPTANFAFGRDNDLGRFSTNLSLLHTEIRTDDGVRGGVVIGETATFRDPMPVFLAHQNVRIFTIAVTDPDRTRVYLPGRDYIVLPFGRYTALARVPTGQIADRQTVSVSYLYRVLRDYAVSRDRGDLRIQQDFKGGFTPYYAASIQEEDVSQERYLTWEDRDIQRHRIGATFRQPRWSIGIEYEYNDDTIDPYDALHLNGDVVLLQRARQSLSGRGNISRFDFEGTEDFFSRDTTLLDLGLNYRYAMTTRLEANAAALYRFETDSLFGRTQGVDLTGSIAYRIGQFSILFEIEYDRLDLPGSDDDTLAAWIKLRRDIPIIERGIE